MDGHASVLEASAEAAAAWLLSDAFEERLFSFFPCTDLDEPGSPSGGRGSPTMDDPNSSKEMAVEVGVPSSCPADLFYRHAKECFVSI